jgi:PIN domain nuclease of toxin-antitoxin system
MRLLLDTHIWLWSLAEPRRLSGRVRRELRETNNELWLSSVSNWEVLLIAGTEMLENWAFSPRTHVAGFLFSPPSLCIS